MRKNIPDELHLCGKLGGDSTQRLKLCGMAHNPVMSFRSQDSCTTDIPFSNRKTRKGTIHDGATSFSEAVPIGAQES